MCFVFLDLGQSSSVCPDCGERFSPIPLGLLSVVFPFWGGKWKFKYGGGTPRTQRTDSPVEGRQ